MLGKEVCTSLLFYHSFLGCDTTSKPFKKGKAIALKLQNTNPMFKNLLTKVFYKSNSTYQEIEVAGESVMCMIYGGLPSDGIDMLWYKIFKKKFNNANVTKAINPQDLPPTKGVLKYHCIRAYLQV